MSDSLEGFRTNPLLLAPKIGRPQDNKELFQAMYVGDIALSVMQGLATNESAAELVANLIAVCEVEVRQYMQRLLECENLDSKEARDIHFEARVSAAVLTKLNKMVRDGHSAAMQLGDKGEV